MKKQLFIIIITLLLIFPISVNAQTLKLTEKYVNDTEVNSSYYQIFNKYDRNGKVNGYILVFDAWNSTNKRTERMIKVYKNNNQLEKVYYEDDLISIYNEPTKENPIELVVFSDYYEDLNATSKGYEDTIIIMYDDTDITKKEIKWTAQFGGNEYDQIYYGFKDYDGDELTGYIFIGESYSTDIEGLFQGPMAVKYDLNGKLIWKKNIDYPSYMYLPAYNNNGQVDGIITTWYYRLTKIKPDYSNEFDIENNSIELYSLAYTRDKNNKIIGYTTLGNTCDNSVNERKKTEFKKRITESITKNVNNIIKTPNAKRLATEHCYPIIIRYDLNGNELDKKVLNNLIDTELYQIKETQNARGEYDGYLIIGAIPKQNDNNNYDGIILELDHELNEENKEIYNEGAEYNSLFIIEDAYDMNGNLDGYNILGNQTCQPVPINYNNNNSTMKLLTDIADYCTGDHSGFILRYSYPKFPIVKEELKNGIIEIDQEAPVGSIVKLKITPNEGYYVEKVIVLDEKGNEIEVKDNSFIMPEGKVNVSAIFRRIINPATLSTIAMITIITIMIGIGTLTTIKNKKTKQSDLI